MDKSVFEGEWLGQGKGIYPTISNFSYGERLSISDDGRPFLILAQSTWNLETMQAMHIEHGYLRFPGDEVVEALIVQPSGVSEVLFGWVTFSDGSARLDLTSTAVTLTPTAKEVVKTRRIYDFRPEVLSYRLEMAAVGQPLQLHLEAELRRVGTSEAASAH